MIWELDTYDFGSQDADIYNINQNIVHRIEQNGNDFGSQVIGQVTNKNGDR